MINAAQLAPFMDVALEVEALVTGPRLRVRDLLALGTGSLVTTNIPAGETVQIVAGHSLLGEGELASSRGKAVVRVLSFREDR